jgi:hypothetical protein
LNSIKIKIIQRLGLMAAMLLLLGTSPLFAQIGGISQPLGIYGSVPVASRPNVRFVRVEVNGCSGCRVVQTTPVNGLSNFNIFYTWDGANFLTGGTYKLTYLDASLTTSYGTDIVTYSPNSHHTNGVQVRAFNSPPATPRGIHGIYQGYIPGGGGTVAPLENGTVYISAAGGYYEQARSNGDGYYSIYYDNSYPNSFVPAITNWNLYFSLTLNGCAYNDLRQDDIIWNPSTDPNSPNYYVAGAEVDLGTRILTSTTPGCAP